MIPTNIGRSATQGERTLFSLLKETLPDDCVVYYEPFIEGKKPDFILIIPHLGVLVLEVKDYKLGTIQSATSEEWVIQSSGKFDKVKSPLNQARDYAFLIANKLKKDPFLMASENGLSRLKFPYGFGTVFPKLSRLDYITSGLDEVLPDHLALFEDDLLLDLLEMFTGMFSVRWKGFDSISPDEIDRIRFNLFPEVRIGVQKAYNENDLLKLKTLKTMNIYQEILAKQVGDGHRLLRGVAGSGKTLVLIARAKTLANSNTDQSVLIICYSVTLSSDIRNKINSSGSYPNIEVVTFHEFLYKATRSRPMGVSEGFVSSVEAGLVPIKKYDHILIDEGQDFESEWLRLVVLCLEGEEKSLFICEDKAQDIFKRKTSLSASTGLDFRGRSRVLTVNYRNPKSIVKLAWDFYKKFCPDVKDEELIDPKTTSREGSPSEFNKFDYFNDESNFLCSKIKSILEETKYSESDIAIVYRVRKARSIDYISTLCRKLTESDISFNWISDNRESKASYNAKEQKVSLLTLDGAKGLDFPIVFVINLDNTPFILEPDVEREASLLYIGLTRPTEKLYLSCSGTSEFTTYLESIV
jgi:hypothetical protein